MNAAAVSGVIVIALVILAIVLIVKSLNARKSRNDSRGKGSAGGHAAPIADGAEPKSGRDLP